MTPLLLEPILHTVIALGLLITYGVLLALGHDAPVLLGLLGGLLGGLGVSQVAQKAADAKTAASAASAPAAPVSNG